MYDDERPPHHETDADPSYLSAFCPKFHAAIELIGRRWTGAILRAMLAGAVRFSDIAAAVPGLSDRLLSERLKELESAGIVTRTVIPATPVRVEYGLTEKGQALHEVIVSVSSWAEEWAIQPEEAATAPDR
jgi:DNA-binding HxlR family transcriptional regulator